MSRNAYILEAFKQFNSLVEEEESIGREEIPMYDVDSEHIHDFLDTVGDDTADVDVIDLEAEAEEDLKQSYVGKVILDCNVCHSNIFVNKEDVIVNEDGSANVDLECPYCMSNEGYTIIGQVEPYSEETEEEIEIEEEPVEFEEESTESEQTIEEGLMGSVAGGILGSSIAGPAGGLVGRKIGDMLTDSLDEENIDEDIDIKGIANKVGDIADGVSQVAHTIGEDVDCDDSINECDDQEVMTESIENVSIDTEDETMTMTTKEDGGIMIETSPRESIDESDEIDDEIFNVTDEDEFNEEPSDLEPGDEIIAPISDEEENEIELNSEVDALSDEDVDSLGEPDDMSEFEDVEEIDVDEFDEEAFNELGESYLKRHYDNVAGFKTTNAKVFNESLIIEGIIKFNSGNVKGTTFVFEATEANDNSILFEGFNKQISRGKKTFKMSCLLEHGVIKPNKLGYNYITKNELNESVRVNGTCKVK